MACPGNINPRIISSLYCEALVLSDEVRAAVDHARDEARDSGSRGEEDARIALSCEALRTTTRLMHSIAWLLNHRAYFDGELSELQLRRHGRLTPNFPIADRDRLALIGAEIRDLIIQSERLYDRIVRLEGGWRATDQATPPKPMDLLRARLGVEASAAAG